MKVTLLILGTISLLLGIGFIASFFINFFDNSLEGSMGGNVALAVAIGVIPTALGVFFISKALKEG